MRYIISENQSNKLVSSIQSKIDEIMRQIVEESEEWGMDEMDAIHEVNSVNKIVVDRVDPISKIKVHLDIYKNSKREDFDDLINEIEARIQDWFPNIELYIDDIIDDRKFGPGIDW